MEGSDSEKIFRFKEASAGDGFFLGLIHGFLRDFIIRKPSLSKYHEWSELCWNDTLWKDVDPGIAEVEDGKKRLAGLKEK